MTEYQVTVTMSPETVAALDRSGSNLYVFRAVQADDRAGLPVVWMRPPYSARTYVVWQHGHNAYTASCPVEAGQPVQPGFVAAIEEGQLLSVHGGGTGTVSWDGHPGTISVHNTTATYFTCGIGCGDIHSGGSPYCAFPLYGNNLQVVVPLQKILLMFSTLVIAPGTIIDDFYARAQMSFGPGVMIELVTATERALSYDINNGWAWGGYNWAQQIAAGTDLVPLLIEDREPAATHLSSTRRSSPSKP
jgi:hypothetical protein